MVIACFDSNGEIEIVCFKELQKRFPHTSFCTPISESGLPEGYFLINADDKPDTVRRVKEKVIYDGTGPKVIWEFVNTDEEDRDLMEKRIYSEIERLTKETDWAVRDGVPDFISNKYKEYRSKLWNIPDQEGFPFNVEFPEIK